MWRIWAVCSLSALGLAGCGVGGGTSSAAGGGAVPGLALQGSVHGGNQPVSGATIQLWSVGTGGYGSASTALLVSGVTTNASGGFSITNDYLTSLANCQSANPLVYITATGGNPGLGGTVNNPELAMMAALGPCSSLSGSTNININEVTTVASVYALAQFMTSYSAVGSYSASTVGITNAFATVKNLVSISSGAALSYTPAGNGIVPAAEINTLANMLASCVSSSGSMVTGQPCANLMTATTYGSSVPGNTIQAVLNIALHPGYNPGGQFNLVSTNGPFQPTLSSAPNDWAMAVQIAGTGAYPSDMAIDAAGDVWVANYGATNTYGGTSEVNNLGVIVLSAQYSSSASGIDTIAIDLGGNAWVGNYANAEIFEVAPLGASTYGPFQVSETNQPETIAVDGNNHVWITNGSSNSVTELSSQGGSSAAISPSGGYTGGGLNLPVGIAIDASNDAWIADLSGNTLTEISPSGTVSGGYTGAGLNQPAIVALDGSSHVWVVNNNANTVAEFSSGGAEIDPGGAGISGGGISEGGGLSVDGGGNIWVADGTGNALSEISSSGAVLSPSAGFQGASPQLTSSTNCRGKSYSGGNLNYPFTTRVDGSGNVWVINYCEVEFSSSFYAGLTEFVGLGTPTIQPLAAAVQQGLIGKPPGTAPGVTLAVTTSSLPSSVQTAKYSYQLLAKGGTANGYAWTVMSGSSTLSSVGLTLSSGGLLSGTLSGTVSGASIGFKVTDSGGNTATATLSLTVSAVGTLSITTTNIASGTVGTSYNQTFAATGGSGNYTWSIPSGTQLTALNSEGLGYGPRGSLNGTPSAAGSFPFTMQVTDLATGQTATAPYTLIVSAATLSQCTHDGSGNAILNGHYAFLLGGFDPNGHYYDQIGSFVANGAGSISSGLVDANGDNQLSQFASGEVESSFTGTYSIGSADDRGIMTITNASSGSTSIFCFAADTVVSGVANSGRVIQADGSGYIQTGVFAIQNTANFNAAALAGGYAFGVQGVDTPPNRRASVGQFTLNGSGGVSSGQLDFASANNSGSSESYYAGLTYLSGSGYTMGSNGRGTLTLNVSASGNSESLTFVTYEFGSNQLFMLSTNDSTVPLLLGQATPQTLTTFTTANIAGRGVFRSDGSPGAVADDMQVGVLTYDGSGNATFLADENDAGTITAPTSVKTANYSVTSLGYLTAPNGGSHPVNFYLYAPGGGYGTSTSSEVDFWSMVPQTLPNGGFTGSSISGSYALGTVPNAAYSTTGAGLSDQVAYPTVQAGTVSFSSGSLSLTEDEVYPPGTAADVSTGQVQSSIGWVLDSTYGSSYGRVVLGGSGGLVGYIVSPTQVFLLNDTSGKNGGQFILDHQ